jgi:hypothetical protein
MEYIVIIVISIIFLLILKYAWNIKIKDIKKLKEIGYDKTLNEITNKLPENREICKTILKKLNNENVNIKEELEEENRNTKRKDGNNKNITIAKEKNLNKEDEKNKKATASLYIAITSTIFIADVKNTFTRVQTIVHECLHSVQNRRTLLFNFIFSNLYFLYFIAVCILTILKMNPFPMLSLWGLALLSAIYYAIRSYLEVDAMTKAKPLTKEYLVEEGSLTKEEQETILENLEIINEIGIKLTNFSLIAKCIIKIIIFTIILFIFL